MPITLTPEQRDRAAGVLLGTAVGDALGAGYEFTRPTSTTLIAMIGGGVFDWAPGEWTDDTAMTIAIARAAAEGGELHTEPALDEVAAQFVLWWDSGPKDVGNQTRRVLYSRPASARQMRAAARGFLTRSGGNGSLMRTAAVALTHLDNAEICAAAAESVSLLTHPGRDACQACILWTVAVRHAILHGTYDGVRDGLRYVDTRWADRLHEAETGTPADFGKNGWVVHALQTAWWAITHAEDLPHALELAVRAGGDTDTTAAIAGALLGARFGAHSIPKPWVQAVHGYPQMQARDLIELTQQVLRKSARRNPYPVI